MNQISISQPSNQDRAFNGDRVREHTAPKVNERIDRTTEGSVDACISNGPEAIRQRLAELDHEWDVDRALMVNFAVVGGAAFSVGLARYASTPMLARRRTGFLSFFGTQLGFLLLHGVVGWCPPASLFRRLGFRTQREIEAERSALCNALALTDER